MDRQAVGEPRLGRSGVTASRRATSVPARARNGASAAPSGVAPASPRRTSRFARWSELLPAPRGAAIVQLWRGLRALLFGLPSGPVTLGEKEGWLVPWWLRRGRAALKRGDGSAALREAGRVLDRHPDNPRGLALRAAALAQVGDWTTSATTIRAQRRRRDSLGLRNEERACLGLLTVSDPRWLPWVPGPPRPIADPDQAIVVDLVADDVDMRHDIGKIRSMLESQREAGLRPIVVTPPGMRDSAFGDAAAGDGDVERVALRLPKGYEAGRYADLDLLVYAWQVARELRDARPAMIWAFSSDGGYLSLLVAVALREHFRLPVVSELWGVNAGPVTRSDAPSHVSSEAAARRMAQQTRLLRAADAIVVADESLCDEVVRRGISPGVIGVRQGAPITAAGAAARRPSGSSGGGNVYRSAYDGAIARFGMARPS
jgi:hypothetical protein